MVLHDPHINNLPKILPESRLKWPIIAISFLGDRCCIWNTGVEVKPQQPQFSEQLGVESPRPTVNFDDDALPRHVTCIRIQVQD